MYTIYCWLIIAWRFLRYFAYRGLGIGSRPTFKDIYPEGVVVFDTLMRWPKRLRVRGLEHVPENGPAIFVGNHTKVDDPFVMYRSIHFKTKNSYPCRYMMRDDFFVNLGKGKSRWYDIDDWAEMAGAHLISRGKPKLSQLKPFVQILKDGASFIMYPSGTRSRTGIFFEYRDGVEEPGGVTFFAAQAQRTRPEPPVSIVPVTRTFNPVNKGSAVVFGASEFLAAGARRDQQRELDFYLVERMAQLIELHVTHVVGALLYLACLHNRANQYTVDSLTGAVQAVFDAAPHPLVDERGVADIAGEVKRTLDYFEETGIVRRENGSIVIDRDRTLAAPDWDTNYRTNNPIKYQVNQILHLRPVVAAIETAFNPE